MANEDLESKRRGSASATIRALILGVNAWVVAVALPLAFASWRQDVDVAWSLIPLALLISGVYRSSGGSKDGEGLLLVAFPVGLGGVVAWLSIASSADPYTAAGVAVAALSLLLYLAAAIRAVDTPLAIEPTRVRPLATLNAAIPRARHRRLASRLLVASGLASVGLATLSPLLGKGEEWAAWGEAAAEARVLTAVVAGALACTALVAFIGPATRARRGAPLARARSDRRAMLFTTMAVGATAGWILLERLG